MKVRLGHTGIVVRDLDAQIDFYTRVLGLRLVTRFRRRGAYIDTLVGLEGVELEAAILASEERGDAIELLKYHSHPDHSPARPSNALYCSHVMFEVDDVGRAVEELRRARATPISEPALTPGGEKLVIYCRDPEGTLLEFAQVVDRDRQYPEK